MSVTFDPDTFGNFIKQNRHLVLESGRTVAQEAQDCLAKASNAKLREILYGKESNKYEKSPTISLKKIVWMNEQAAKAAEMCFLHGDTSTLTEAEKFELFDQILSFARNN